MSALVIRTIDIIMTITVAVAHGMDVRLTGRYKAAFVSRIVMVRGTSMEVGRATTDIKLSEAAASAAFSFGLVPQLLLLR
jgi:uncharacterized NAD-dependent epimerase/dehydratase family protein